MGKNQLNKSWFIEEINKNQEASSQANWEKQRENTNYKYQK